MIVKTLCIQIKETRANTTMKTSASSDIGHLKKKKKMMDKLMIRPLSCFHSWLCLHNGTLKEDVGLARVHQMYDSVIKAAIATSQWRKHKE